MTYLGNFATAVTIDHKFTTVTTTGAPTTLAGTPAISVYKDNSTTQSTSGVTLTVDFDSVTGLNNVRIDTSSDGTFYSAGSNFQVVITTGTVGGTSVVGYVVGSFALENRANLTSTTRTNLATAFASTLAEESAVPAANAPVWTKLNWLFAKGRNKMTQTATTQTLRNDGDSGSIGTATVSDDSTTYTRGKFA